MSRIGHKVIEIPAGVTVDFDGNHVTVKGPKGTLTNTFNPHITYKVEGNTITCVRPDDTIAMKKRWTTYETDFIRHKRWGRISGFLVRMS